MDTGLTPQQIAAANPPGAYKECRWKQQDLIDQASLLEFAVLNVIRAPGTVQPLSALCQIANDLKNRAETDFVWVNPAAADPTPPSAS